MFTLGNKTQSIIQYGPESHKLMMEFTPDGTIEPGTPVILDATTPGTVKPATAGDVSDNIIGYAINAKGRTAYGESSTIAMRGFMVVSAIADGAITPGPVEFVEVNSEGYTVVQTSTDASKTIGHALHIVADAGETFVVLK